MTRSVERGVWAGKSCRICLCIELRTVVSPDMEANTKIGKKHEFIGSAAPS